MNGPDTTGNCAPNTSSPESWDAMHARMAAEKAAIQQRELAAKEAAVLQLQRDAAAFRYLKNNQGRAGMTLAEIADYLSTFDGSTATPLAIRTALHISTGQDPIPKEPQ